MFDAVTDHPGAHLRDLARRCRLPLGTTLYHLDCLEAAEMVSTRRDGRYKRYFAVGGLGRPERDLMGVLRRDAPRRILLALVVEGALTQRELCDKLGLSRSTVSFHLGRLVSDEVVERLPTRPEHRHALAQPQLVRDVLLRFRESLERGNAEDARLYDEVDLATAPASTTPFPGPAAKPRAGEAAPARVSA